MLRDLRIFRRNSEKSPHTNSEKSPHTGVNNENVDPSDSSAAHLDLDSSRAPLNMIQETSLNPRLPADQELVPRIRIERTPSKNGLAKGSDALLRTPDKPGVAVATRNRFGWGTKNESGTNAAESGDEAGHYGASHLPPGGRGATLGAGGVLGITTPRAYHTAGKASYAHSEGSSTQSTPTKSVNKPPNPGLGGPRHFLATGARMGTFSSASRGMPISSSSIVNTVEVSHFELREDPSFWMDHNVQVVIRVRPLNTTERSLQGYNRCLKQESAQSISWIGQPEARFTFDHVACEAINQERLFRVAGLPMVENCISGYNSCMFAYGQTGSGKTYTMLGEIDEMDIKANPHRGMTPRIFEFLFARIRAEEESRRDEKLKYSCQCSFLEIYNEQITDLLDPSSTNLLLREDIQKGVYVENLSEFEVETVNDVLKLLIQGSANRKVAATNMNRESSRSHSVFTCVIKSRWEKESTNMRFARLNLVDLAGSERQKTSGAEGERLKEAANINKSLSTLGHVIMILVDVAHGKPRHVPYRDSRLTFLLQDSLGGNSKTLIIANVSPSVCCASETLSTLKFAQRAKLVQNNAFVNEDATGDTIALQHQIRLLKEELSMLKRQNVSRSLSFRSALFRNSDEECASPAEGRSTVSSQEDGGDLNGYEALAGVRVSNKQLKSLEAILAGALRREKMADTTIKQLEAEIEQLNRLVRQRVEDTQHTKMMLKFREDKIQRINSVVDGLMPLESYLLEEKNSQAKEIQVLQAKVDRNPEVTRFALENIRLLDQLRRFQDFYEEGEKELLLTEVADLRDQLVQILDGKSQIDDRHLNLIKESQGIAYAEFVTSIKDDGSLQIELKQTRQELEDCRNNLKSSLEINAKLDREIDDLRSQLNNLQPLCRDIYPCAELQDMDLCSEGSSKVTQGEEKKAEYIDDTCKKLAEVEEILNLQLELDILKTILGEERVYRSEVEQRAFQLSNKLVMAEESFVLVNKKYEDAKTELADARSVIEALESHHITLINEMEDLKGKNNLNLELLRKEGLEISNLKKEHPIHFEDAENQSYMHLELKNQPLCSENSESPLQVKLKRMQASLEKARILNMRYQTDHESQTSHEQEMDDVRKSVEAETAEVIVCLQEELDTLQQLVNASSRNEFLAKQSLMALETELKELQDRLYLVNQDNKQLSELVEEKNVELRVLTEEWEKLENDIAAVLVEGNMALEDASDQVVSINNSFPQRNWIGEQVGRIVKTISEKDLLIEELHSGLEDAQKVRGDMEWKLRSLRGATLAITEAQQQENRDKEQEIFQLTLDLSEKLSTISELEKSLRLGEDQIRKAELCASGALMAVNRLSEIKSVHLDELKGKVIQLNLSIFHKDALLQDQISINADSEKQIQSLKVQLKESEDKVSKLQLDLAKEKEHIHTTECLLEKVKQNVAISRFADELLETKEKLNHLKMGVSTLNSSIIQYTENVGEPAKEHTLTKEAFANVDDDYEDRTDVESTKGIREKEKRDVHQVTCFHTYDSAGKNSYICTLCNGKFDPCQQKLECGRSAIDVYDNNTTILLRKELEAALDSLKGVQSQMHKLLEEREDIKKSEMQSRKCIEHLTGQVLRMEMEFNVKEKQLEFRILELDHKMEAIEGKARESIVCWHGAKENLEQEVRDAKVIAAQKTVEASNFLARFEEAQETMREADCMVNVLMAANEAAKLEIKRHLESEATLISERDILIHEVHSLHSSIDTHKQEYKNLEKKFLSDMSELRSFTLELENCFGHVQTTFVEEFKLIVCDIHCFKSELLQTAVLLRTWLEDIWSDIIMKDCSMCVLHLCHMGILLEAITGLNAENGLLHFGLCESNSIIAGLREHNVKARNELEICSIVKGKLLVDINNSFSRITRKENESEQLRAKFSSLEKKVVELQLQEDLMLARANSMGSDLAVLMKDLDTNHINVLLDLSSKEFELFILKSELTQKFLKSKQVAVHIKNLEQQADAHVVLIEKIKNETFLLKINGELDKQLMMDMEAEIALLKGEVKESYIQLAIANNGTNSIVLKLNQSNEKIAEMENKMRTLEQDFNHISLKEMELKDQLSRQEIILNEKTMELKEVEQSREEVFKVVNTKNKEVQHLLERMDAMSNENSALNCDLEEATEELGRLSTLAELLQNENHRILENLQVKEAALESSSSGMVALQGENEELKNEVLRLKSEDSIAMEHSQEKRVEVMSSMFIPHYDQENHKLQDMICSLQARISSLQNELGLKKADSNELRCSHSVYSNELHLKAEGNEIQFDKVNAFKSENNALRHEIISLNQMKDETIAWLFLNQKNCSDSIKLVNLIANRVFLLFDVNCVKLIDKMCSEIDECEQRTSKFIEELELFDLYAKELFSENISLRSELMRKEEVTKGLLFDLSLLQESASIAKDQKDEIEELEAALESLEDELTSRSSELDVAVAHGQILEAHLFEKTNLISTLQFELAKEHESLKLVCGENIELKAHMEDILMKKNSAKQDLAERNELIERLEMELLEVRTLLDHKEHFLIDLQNDVTKLAEQRDPLISEVLILKEELEMAHALAEENEAIATEARQIAESRRSYAEDKEEEVKLLETSVQELECTVNVLENKVEIVKGEAERQRLQREEIEMELQEVRKQMLTACHSGKFENVTESGKVDFLREIEQKVSELQVVEKKLQILEKDVAEKDAEIVQCKAHIFELNMHAEAQTQENKLKINELETMVQQVKIDSLASNAASLPSTKSEKSSAKSRGSGSPFKCIGLGLTQQINAEKDEELTAGKRRIEELEALAASRQKEIFMLNSRLAKAESMTHDVLRDLLGVKLDMTNYAFLLDHQQVHKMTETAHHQCEGCRVKEQEMHKLKIQLNEFIEERQGWLDETNRRHSELVTAQIELEKLRQRDQMLTTENEILQVDNMKHKKMIMELEDEMKQLSSQQNLQQRIHHHVKIKEDNNMLRVLNKDLNAKLQQSEEVLSRLKEELAHYRTCIGKSPYNDIDEEQHLRNKLEDTEEERVQLAQKLLSLCTNILKAAGITQSSSTIISPSEAEDALNRLKNRADSLEKELQDLKFKRKISSEKMRLAELRQQQSSSLYSRADENCPQTRSILLSPNHSISLR